MLKKDQSFEANMKFDITSHPSTQDIDFLTQKINEEIPTKYGIAHPFAIFVKTSNGSILAGCNGSVIFGAIYTDQLWVHPEHRGKGVARRLMEQVHQYGKQNGCAMATVSTLDFQVPEFYQKLGYKTDFARHGYKNGARCVFLSKVL